LTWTNSAGGSGTLSTSTPWTIPSIVLADGPQTITVTAVDPAGNVGTDTLDVTYDHTLPTIQITSPSVADTYVTMNGTVDLAGSASDDTTLLAVTWINAANGLSGSVPGSTSWNIPSVNLLPGANPITVVAMDLAGNVRSDTIT